MRISRYAKDRGRLYHGHVLCEICGSGFRVGRHHKFKQDKWARKLYPEFIDHPRNIQYACVNCHAGHESPKLIMWDEYEFCRQFGIEPRSETARLRKQRESQLPGAE